MNSRFFNLGKTPREIHEMLQTVCRDEDLSRSSVFDWFKRFKDGIQNLQDDPKCGHPSDYQNADTKANVLEMLIRGRRWALRIMADDLNINKDAVARPRTAFAAVNVTNLSINK